jgi:cytidylate kinase
VTSRTAGLAALGSLEDMDRLDVAADLAPAVGAAVLAVDGPSGSGKSSVSRGVAQRLGLRYLDTGAMYRAVTWWMLEHGVDVEDAAAVAAHIGEPVLDVTTDPDSPGIRVGNVDVSGPIRGPEVTAAVSAVSAVPEVRARLVALQREAAADGGIVVEGRDIGSVVLPDATLKVFLTAHATVRSSRRAEELRAAGISTDPDDTLSSIQRRDHLDSTRQSSPLLRAADATEVDATELSLEEVIDTVVALLLDRLTSADLRERTVPGRADLAAGSGAP